MYLIKKQQNRQKQGGFFFSMILQGFFNGISKPQQLV